VAIRLDRPKKLGKASRGLKSQPAELRGAPGSRTVAIHMVHVQGTQELKRSEQKRKWQEKETACTVYSVPFSGVVSLAHLLVAEVGVPVAR